MKGLFFDANPAQVPCKDTYYSDDINFCYNRLAQTISLFQIFRVTQTFELCFH